ncbi:hypothetical protein ACLBKU_17420 [Erythrobacter sp. NE805]|uniref:hypothetical protein n=1 Tax=Erythrobacter sp. NE805 TaxID=3389875 RepID=UPI00396B3DFC
MEPLDHVQDLISSMEITTAQWNLYHRASEYLDDHAGARSVILRFRDYVIQAFKVSFDTDLPGVLIVRGPGDIKAYLAWADLYGVVIEDD